MSDVAVSIVAAVAENGVIGNGGAMPWRLSADLRRFKALTLGKPVIMGRRTFESIGKPLAGRMNIVVSRQPEYRPEGVAVVADFSAALERAKAEARTLGVDEVFVIGGGEIYAAAMPLADRLHITHVAARPAGDTSFPAIDPDLWERTSEERVPAGEKDSAATTYAVYRRRRRVTSR
ncbi:MAG TPA: dihydrofolate reductase [Bauldia sp.]|nr:dihydrofolate reductase [Bauldia sp.]